MRVLTYSQIIRCANWRYRQQNGLVIDAIAVDAQAYATVGKPSWRAPFCVGLRRKKLNPPTPMPHRPSSSARLTPRVLGLIAASAVVAGGAGFAYGATTTKFTDVQPTDWFAPYVSTMVQQGILTGYPDGTFRPSQGVNRAELAKILNGYADQFSTKLTALDKRIAALEGKQTTSGATTTTTSNTAKTYQQVFVFSGTGMKTSEPFTITGDRLKVVYDCQGTYCGAMLYKVGGKVPAGVIMNNQGSSKDETVLYEGAGQYYIDASVIGSYTMTVYDYK